MKSIILFFASILLSQAGTTQELPKDYLPASFHAERRTLLREQMPENSVAVFFSNPIRNRANDVDYMYHQDPDFYYLTGYKEPHSVLLIFSEERTVNGNKTNEILFAQARNPQSEMWTGRRLGPIGASEKLHLRQVEDHSDFDDDAIDFSSFDKVFFFGFENDVRNSSYNQSDLYDLIEQFKESADIPEEFSPRLQQMFEVMENTELDLKTRKERIFVMSRFTPGLRDNPQIKAFLESADDEQAMQLLRDLPDNNLDVTSLAGFMSRLREIKSEEELVLLRKAVDVSCVGQIEVMKAMRPGMSEMEIQGIHEFVFRKYGSEYEGYPSIVGAGNNGCILHYVDNNRPRLGSDLVLMDLGAEYHGYTADVTRTIPADGTFSDAQKSIYNIVLEAQQAGFEACQPGADFQAPHRAASQVINQGLAELGIIEPGARHRYFPHGTSHYLGLDVHDRGTYGKLKPGTVITVEPGIYIPDNSPCDEKWWGIAVRIEDDVLITETGWTNLSERAPRSVEEIETMMALPSALDDFILPNLDGN